ncbi:universal stress protein [Streptomyces sp. Edi2]|uniref:universal stress protein n=1 Tax=Streptomyces sp. Edi2 TaxID=3162528 RepID=UPI003306831F
MTSACCSDCWAIIRNRDRCASASNDACALSEDAGFAFEAAALRAAPLLVVHGRNPPPYYAYGLGAALAWGADISAKERETLRQALLPWSEKHPGVDLVQEPVIGEPAHHLLDSAAHAQLVVIGRRRPPTRASWPRIGHVAHAVLHHCPAPVAVVPHG